MGAPRAGHRGDQLSRFEKRAKTDPAGRPFPLFAAVVADLRDPHNQVFLNGHDGPVTCLAMSPDGRLLASGQHGENSDVIVWDFVAKRLLFRLSEHDHGIKAVAFSHDSRLLATVGVASDGKMFAWEMSKGYIVASCTAEPAPVDAIAWGGMVKDVKRRDTAAYLLATTGSKQIRLWSLDGARGVLTPEPIRQNLARDFTCLTFSPDGERLFAGSQTGDVSVVSLKDKVLTQTFLACGGGVHAMRTHGNDSVVVGGGDGTVTVFVAQGDERPEWIADRKGITLGAVMSLSFNPQGTELVAGTTGGCMYLVDYATAATTLASEHPSHSVVAVDFPPNVSDEFATVSEDGIMRVWNGNDYSVKARCSPNRWGRPNCVAYPGGIVITGWADGHLRAHDAETGELLWTLENAHKGGVAALAVMLNSRRKVIVSGGVEGELRVWDLKTRQLVSHLKEHAGPIVNIVPLSDGSRVLSCSTDRTFLTWDLDREVRLTAHIQKMGGLNRLALCADERRVLTVGKEKRVTVWDLGQTGPTAVISPAHADEATAIALSPDNSIFATGGSDQVVKIWSMETGLLITDCLGHSGTISDLQFSPDCKQLISTGLDGAIIVWNIF